MDAHDVLDRIPAMAEAMQGPDGPDERPDGEWKLHAHEPGRAAGTTVRMPSYSQSRTLAIELSGLGLVVAVCDPDNNPRLQLWPPGHDHH